MLENRIFTTLAALGLAFALLCISLPVWAADLATAARPTLTPAATPSPKLIVDKEPQAGVAQSKRYTAVQTFEAGAMVGTEAGSASKISFMKLGQCTVNLGIFAAVATPSEHLPPANQTVWCTMTGAAVGDSVFCSLRNFETTEYYGLAIHSCQVIAANTIKLVFIYGGPVGLDPGALVADVLVLR